jgi:hypothetical protein
LRDVLIEGRQPDRRVAPLEVAVRHAGNSRLPLMQFRPGDRISMKELM